MYETVEIGSGRHDGAPDFRYVLKLTRQGRGAKPVSFWADSATCPAIRPIIAGMTKITMPHPASYGLPGGSQKVMVDGVDYELSAPSTDVMGVLTIRSNEGSPLSHWVDDAFERLAGCWASSPPR